MLSEENAKILDAEFEKYCKNKETHTSAMNTYKEQIANIPVKFGEIIDDLFNDYGRVLKKITTNIQYDLPDTALRLIVGTSSDGVTLEASLHTIGSVVISAKRGANKISVTTYGNNSRDDYDLFRSTKQFFKQFDKSEFFKAVISWLQVMGNTYATDAETIDALLKEE